MWYLEPTRIRGKLWFVRVQSDTDLLVDCVFVEGESAVDFANRVKASIAHVRRWFSLNSANLIVILFVQ